MLLSECRNLLRGIVSIRDNEDGTQTPLRFTSEQLDFYAADPGYRIRTQASAGVCLDCITDAVHFTLDGIACPGSSVNRWNFDLVVDHRLYAHREGSLSCPVKLEFDLPEGRKGLQLVFPCMAETRVRSLTLDGGCFTEPVEHQLKLLCLGDSITQGYTVQFPSLAYATALAMSLDAEMLNQAVAGETFQPNLLAELPAFQPDLITVAYGTNDWNCKSPDVFVRDAQRFFARLRLLYPETNVAVITPIWRGDTMEYPERWPFAEIDGLIRFAVQGQRVKVIEGTKQFPAVTELMADGFLHPNDLGHQLLAVGIAENLHK